MKSRGALFLRVGMLLAGTIVLLVGGIFILTGDRLSQGKMYETYFRESVQGLDVGAPVKFRGVTLGRVTNIGLVAAEYAGTADDQVMDASWRLIVVRFKIDPKRVGRLPDTTKAVASGLRARLANQGLTGVMYMELDFLPAAASPLPPMPWQPRDDFIPSTPSTIAEVQTAVTDVLGQLSRLDLKHLMGNIDGLIGDLRAELANTGDVHATIHSAHDILDTLADQLKRADLPALSAQLRRTGAAVETLAGGRQTREVLEKARDSLAHVPALVASLQAAANRASNGIGDAQADLAPILQDARITLQNLREASDALRRDPGRLLWQGAPPKDRTR